jgi:DNA-binding NarL/FixJ family response regulator
VLGDDARVEVVVVDDPLESLGVATSLAANGFDVVCVLADSGLLTETVESYRPGLVVIALGGGDWADACAAIAGVVTGMATRVLALTPAGSSTAVQSALDSGCLGVVPRAASVEEFIDAARAVAAGERHLHQHSFARWLVGRDDTGPVPRVALLSGRELEVLGLVAEGMSNVRIAVQCEIASSTVKTHVENVLRKLHATGRAHAVGIALRSGELT